MWIDVKDKLPDLGQYNESEWVLCATSKFGDYKKYGVEHELLYLNGYKWCNNNTDNFDNNPDYFMVTHWMPIPLL
jgi:hypothetical protein